MVGINKKIEQFFIFFKMIFTPPHHYLTSEYCGMRGGSVEA